MSNDKTDNLFDINKMEKTIKKAKRRANWKTVLLTTAVIIIVFVIGAIGNQMITKSLEKRVLYSMLNYQEITGPNKFIGKLEQNYKLLGGENRYTTYKIIEGKVVYTGQQSLNFGLFRKGKISHSMITSPLIIGPTLAEGDLVKQNYNELGQREMVFFYPFIQYSSYRNDLALLDEIGEDKMMEIALSFDRGYTFDEVQAMIPDDVTLTWLWVDDADEEKGDFKYKVYNDAGEMIKEENEVRSEHNVYGVSLFNENGDKRENALLWFISALEAGKEVNVTGQIVLEQLYETLSGDDGKLTGEDLQFFGAVVTGDKHTLSNLKDLPFIKASSIGVITDKY